MDKKIEEFRAEEAVKQMLSDKKGMIKLIKAIRSFPYKEDGSVKISRFL